MSSALHYQMVFLLVSCFIATTSLTTAQVTVVLVPTKDNTLIESPSGSFSNGSGPYFFAGCVGTQGDLQLRRAMLHFDLTEALPQNADIQKAELSLYISRPADVEFQRFNLHKLTNDWGEGSSESSFGLGDLSSPSDATWIHTFYQDSSWVSPGGDFVENPSAQEEMGGEAIYIWKDQQGLIDDIQFCLDNPELN